MAKFRGFNTVDNFSAPFTLTGDELVKRDLKNEFYTKKGERVMRPNFGSIVWDLLMNPMSASLITDIEEDVEKIVGRDPRVSLLNTTVTALEQAIRVDIDLRFIPTENEDTLYLMYVRETAEVM
jgi:phage baseplate assembly protein W|tara:strand:+ start:2456 stop:2827 length:372 start_codon:yes stop_codon:yes gene_type:complete